MKDMFILFVTMSLWDEPHRGRHHFARSLSKDNIVLWINRPLGWKEQTTSKGLEKINDGLYVLHVGKSILPNRMDFKFNLSNLNRLATVLGTIKQYGFKMDPDIVWIYDYKALNFANHYRNTSKCIYFCNDYFGEQAYKKYELRLAAIVDFVFCTAPKLCDRFRAINRQTYLMPHGTYSPIVTQRFIKKEYPKSVGYVGTIRKDVDIKFLWKIINETNFKLVLGGPVTECNEAEKAAFYKLFTHERVTYLGELSRDEAINAILQLDICLLPYVKTFFAEHMFAIKFFEYLAAGKPIVATSYFVWPTPYNRFVTVYNNESINDFLLEAYLNFDSTVFTKSIKLATQSTWEHRIELVSQHLFPPTITPDCEPCIGIEKVL